MKVLYYSPFFPWPADSGIAMRVAGTIHCLTLFSEVDFVVRGSHEQISLLDSDGGGTLTRQLRFVKAFDIDWSKRRSGTRWSQFAAIASYPTQDFRLFNSLPVLGWLQKRLLDEKYDIFLMETEFGGIFLRHLTPMLEKQNTSAVVSFLDVLSSIAERSVSGLRWGVYKARYWADCKKLALYERQLLSHSAAGLAVSDVDFRRLLHLGPRCPLYVLPNGIEVRDWPPRQADGKASNPVLLMVGTFHYPPNEDAFLFFTEEILPKIEAFAPNVKFMAAGKGSTALMRSIAGRDPNIELVGGDGNVQEFYRQATLAVVPLRIGGGTRIKILEAFAMGIPVVSTTIGCEGIDVQDAEHLALADSPAAFAERVKWLLDNPSERASMAAQARALVREKYDWSVIARQFQRCFELILANGKAKSGNFTPERVSPSS